MNKIFLTVALIVSFALIVIIIRNTRPNMNLSGISSSIVVKSPVLAEDNLLPVIFTCQGKGINPPLKITNIPKGTSSLSLIMDDPDAPIGTFTHWLVWNISPLNSDFSESALPSGAIQGVGTSGRSSYTPPCPPTGSHRYIFTIYALNISLDLAPGSNRQSLEQAMTGHIINYGQLITRYGKQ